MSVPFILSHSCLEILPKCDFATISKMAQTNHDGFYSDSFSKFATNTINIIYT